MHFLQVLLLQHILIIAHYCSGFCSHSCSMYFQGFLQFRVLSLSCLLQSFCFSPLLRSVPLGEHFSLWWPLGAESLDAGGPRSLQPGHGCVPPPQTKWSIHYMAYRAGQTFTCPRLHWHSATHHRVRAFFRCWFFELWAKNDIEAAVHLHMSNF